MPLGIYPATLAIVGIVGGLSFMATYTVFHYAEKAGSNLEAEDLLPMAPPYPPLPRFLYKLGHGGTKKEVG